MKISTNSYGGLVIGSVAAKVPRRIRHLIYLDRYIPEDNKSAFEVVPGLETIYKRRALKEKDMEWLVAPFEWPCCWNTWTVT